MAQAAAPLDTRAFAPFELVFAGRYLRARRQGGSLSVVALFSFIGIMLGVATLIVVLSVMNGFRKELLSKIIGVNGHAFVTPIDRPLTDYSEVAARLSKTPGVTLALPVVEGQAFASGVSQGGSGVYARGVREQDIVRIPYIANNVRSGSLANFDAEKGVAIGRRLADQLGLYVGDSLTLISPRGTSTPFGVAPRVKSYPVVAIFEIGMSEYDTLLLFMPFEEAQTFFNRDDDASSIEIYVDDPDRMDRYRPVIEEAIGRPGVVADWRQRNRSYFSALEVERNVMFLILTLIVLVATLNVISGLIILVRDKAQDIAVLRTMGATRGAILRIFLMTGCAIGAAGTFAGFLLGVVFCWRIQAIQRFLSWVTGTQLWDPTVRFLTEIPAEMNPREIAAVVVVTMVLSLLATLYPSWKAAKTDPVEALRYG
ncbi:lipoprotein-releasing ABC transporter permease subunit [Terrarubrum flagellatum]|uniref:lipoprotein-releasing ABC transporter permease subunit n=1 Tax=Terrirubrum flagellatum TaxID=2895980 RepID=UPI00314563E8